MNRKINTILLVIVFLASSSLFAQMDKVRVAVEWARVYAEASTDSYRIETIKKGTVLTLFGSGQVKGDWLYVVYQSPRWNSEVTGFIQAEMVEALSEDQEPERKPKTEIRPPNKLELKQEEKPTKTEIDPELKQDPGKEEKRKEKQEEKKEDKKAEMKEEKPESIPEMEPEAKAEEPIQIVREVGLTSLPSNKPFRLPLSVPFGQNPRIYETQEELNVEALLGEAKPIVEPEAVVKTEVWEKEVVIPEKTDVPEKVRDIEKPDTLEMKEQPVEDEEPEPQIIEQKQPKITRTLPSRGGSLFTLSLGYGPSLGGFGGFIQLNTSSNFSVHWGIGYYPTSLFYPDYDWVQGKALYSVGVKYYLPWRTDQVRPYLDLQYGGISVEAIRVITGVWYYTYVYEEIQKTLWGPSLLAGIELRIGSFGINGAVGASYVLTKWEHWDQSLFVTADIGFLLFF